MRGQGRIKSWSVTENLKKWSIPSVVGNHWVTV